MAKSKSVESARAQMQEGNHKRGIDGVLQGTDAVHFSLEPRMLKVGGEMRKRLCAQVHPVRNVTQGMLCERLAREKRKYSAAEYSMLLNDVLEAVVDELRAGNTVSLPNLGLFTVSIGGSFDPEERSVFRKYPLRANLRVARAVNDRLNANARLKRDDALPPVAHVGRIVYSQALPEDAARWEGDCVLPDAVRPEADTVYVEGVFRNLPEHMQAELQELSASGAPVAALDLVPVDLPVSPSRSGETHGAVKVGLALVRRRLLPGSRWVLRFDVGSEAPSELRFTVADMRPR